MKAKQLKLLPIITLLPVLASCSLLGGNNTSSTQAEITFKTIAQKGVSSLLISSLIGDEDHFFVTSDNISTTFTNDGIEGYEVIIGDIGTGISSIQFQSKKYKLARVITTGNQYLVSLGNDTDNIINDDDYIVSYKRNSSINTITKSIFGVTSDHEVDNYSDLIDLSKKGKYEENDIDYVIMQEPIFTELIESTDKVTNPTIVKTATECGGYPELGVFIADSLSNDSNRTHGLVSLLSTFDKTLIDLSKNGALSTIQYLNKVGDLSSQDSKLGIDASTLRAMQFNSTTKQNQNKLGFNSSAYDIKSFATNNPTSDLYIPTVVDSTLSPYFLK